jgi:hypothetical protein
VDEPANIKIIKFLKEILTGIFGKKKAEKIIIKLPNKFKTVIIINKAIEISYYIISRISCHC